LRASINQAARKASVEGDRQAVATFTAQKTALDTAISQDLSPEAQAAWAEANASHAAKMDRFHTGPQSSIFRVGKDGAPLLESGDVTGKFWNAGGSADKDVQSFRRLVDDNPAMLGQFRRMITTEGAGTQTAAGNLASKFPKWVSQNMPGLREAFPPNDVAALERISEDIKRAAQATDAGASKGSPSYRNVANALSSGLLESPAVRNVLAKIPFTKGLGAVALDGLSGKVKASQANVLANLLSDPTGAAAALENLVQAGQVAPAERNQLLQLIGKSSVKVLPVAASSR
jgi:hypothetical protein